MEIRPVPAELVKPTGFQDTDNALIKKPTFGSIGTQYVRFEDHFEFDEKKSAELGREVKNKVELCLIQNDKFTRCPVRVNDLSLPQRVALASLYERFKTQKDSKETPVFEWDAVSDIEKTLLATCGVFTVEQLDKFIEEDAYKLGPSAKSLRERAHRHMVTKNANDPDFKAKEAASEMALLRKEKEEQAARIKVLEEKMFAREAEKANLEPKPTPNKGGRPRKSVEQLKAEYKDITHEVA